MFGFGSQAPANPQRLTPGQVLQAVLFEGVSPDRAQREHQDRLRQRALLERQMAVLDAATQFAMGGVMPAGGGQEPAVEPGRYNGPIGPGMDGAPLPGAREAAPAPRPQPTRTGTSRDFLPLELAGIAAGMPQLGQMGDTLRKYDPDLVVLNDMLVDRRDPGNTNRNVPRVAEGQRLVFDAQRNPIGVMDLEGYTQSLATREGAKTAAQEAAKARYDFIEVPQSDGSTLMMPRSQALGMGGGPGAGGMGGAGGGFGRPSPQDQTYRTGRAESAGKRYDEIQTAGSSASGVISKLNTLKRLYADVGGGRLAPAGKEIASVARSLGYDGFENLGNMEAAEALGNDLALDMMGGSLGTGFSNADREFVTSMVPRLQQSPEGRAQLIDIGIARAERQQQVADFARKWQQQFGRIDATDRNGKTFEDYLIQWAEQNSAFNQGNR